MEFTVTGELQKWTRTITWRDGRLSADEMTVLYIRAIFDSLEGHRIKLPGGVSVTRNVLFHPLAAFIIICQQYDRIDSITGDIPQIPDALDVERGRSIAALFDDSQRNIALLDTQGKG